MLIQIWLETVLSLTRLRNPGSGERIGAVTESLQGELFCSWNEQLCWALAGKGVPCTLLPGSCRGLPGLELQAHPAAFLLVIKATDMVPAGFPLIDKGWSGVSCDVDVRLDCGVVSTRGGVKGAPACIRADGSHQQQVFCASTELCSQFGLRLWGPGGAGTASCPMSVKLSGETSDTGARSHCMRLV